MSVDVEEMTRASPQQLLAQLHEQGISLELRGEELAVRGEKHRLVPALLAQLRASKGALVALLKSGARGEAAASGEDGFEVPPNVIPEGCEAITPAMLPLLRLDASQIEAIVATVPGGAANVQDIYPLAPLQEGMLFHHRMAVQGDVYLEALQFGFDSRAQLDAFVQALQAVVDRHDILRTALLWEGLPEPVQVVWRKAPLTVEAVRLDARQGDIAGQLRQGFAARRCRIDVRRAPMLRLVAAQDLPGSRWALQLLFHHLAVDSTTMDIVAQEVQAHLLGQAARLPRPLPFRDFVARALLAVPKEAHEAFFRRMLGDVDEPTAPFGLLDVHGDGSRIADARQTLDPGLAQRLRHGARLAGVSAASLCHLAWALVLARTANRDDVVFGTVLFGRLQGGEGAGRVLGPLINTLPLRVRIGDTRVHDGARAVHRLLAELMRHEHAPLSLAQRCSAVRAPAPLFSALLNCRHSAAAAPAPGQAQGAAGESLAGNEDRTNYPLSLDVDDLGDSFELTVQVQQPIDPARIGAYMQCALEALATALETAPATPLASLDVMPPAERRQQIETWNATGLDLPDDLCVHQLFEAQAAKRPDAVALVHEGRRLSYCDLDAQANRLAHHLKALGVGAEHRVALCVERSPEMVVAMLAVLKAGGAYVPLDPSSPAERLAHMLADSASAWLLTQGAVPSLLGPGLQVLDLRADASQWRDRPGHAPDPAGLQPGQLAYVIYTSGSTGMPKGVMVEHRAVCNQVAAMAQRLHLGPDDRFLQFASPAFDVCAEEVFASLASGSSLVLRGEDWLSGAGDFWRRCADHGVTVADLPTAFWSQLVHDGAPVPASIRQLIVGGEALGEAALGAWFRRGGHRPRLFNAYGPTEATINATVHEPAGAGDWRSIGRPMANTRIYLLDAHRQPVPIGVAGEMYIAGAGVARGYLNRPELTAERFVEDRFHGGRMYRTGDLARYLPDGQIEFLGRNDHQVKLRGFRIELGEIEAQLLKQPGIREAVVLAREDRPGDKRLVAYCTGEGELDVQALRSALSIGLPEYMIPAAFVKLEALPLTPNGKLDRKALPAPEVDALAAQAYEAPQGETESTLARIWAEVLQVERVGRHDDFFALGGHSLLAITLIERMRQVGLRADVRSLFTTPTLSALAAQLGAEGQDGGLVPVPPNAIAPGCQAITPAMLPLVQLAQPQIDAIVATVPGGAANVQDIYPLAPLQEGILFHHMMAGQGDVYLEALQFAFDSRARLDGFVQALQAVVDRHDILRTAVLWEGLPEPVQVVWRQAPLPLQELQLDAAEGSVAEQLKRRFDPRQHRIELGRAPLLQLAAAHDEAGSRWVLQLLFHHLAADHTTMDIVAQEVQAHLLGQAERLPRPLPFRDHVAQARLGVPKQEHEAFFRRMLADVDEPTAPFGLLDVRGDGTRMSDARQVLDDGLAARLRQRAQSLGVSVASLCHLAWALVLARAAGRDDVVFGTVLFGRMQGGEGADRVLGLFINTLPLRVRVGETGAREGVLSVHRQLAELLRHEHAPLTLAQRCSAVQAPAPLFSALLNFRHSALQTIDAPAAEAAQMLGGIEDLGGSEERTNYPLTLSVDDLGTGFALTVQVDASIEARRICGHMHRALEQLVEALEQAPETALGRLDTLDATERQQLLVAWNETQADCLQQHPVHELFEAQAARTPQATALVHGEACLSYAELDAQANRLARHLLRLGVQPGECVAIALERSAALVRAELAVLKCGACFVPLDQHAPAQRQAYMITDCGARWLLATSTHAVPEGCCVGLVAVDALELGDLQSSKPACPVDSEAAAYVMYTSGSTGQPKGVVTPHRAISRVAIRNGYAAFDASERMALAANPAFDASTMEVWGALLNGGCIVVIDPQDVFDPARMAQVLERQRVTTLFVTTALFNQYAAAIPRSLGRLKHLLCGGERADPQAFRRVLAAGGPQHLIHCYGPTETTTYALCCELSQVDEGCASVPIGRPIANTRVYLLDAQRQPVPIGAVGEIHIGGAGVARGYLNRPELTAERFVEDPFHGGRMYRTGDLARCSSDGRIEFVGRNDQQVKIRGFRIELGEIEAQLVRQPGIAEAVVLVREDEPGDKRLVAYFTTAAAQEPADAEGLRRDLSTVLPEYMLPAACVHLESLPLTPNGKLDRKALPAPQAQAFAAQAYEAPQGALEGAIAHAWAQVLKFERIGRRDSVFELGAHSLLLPAVCSRLRQEGVAASVADLFQHPTVEGLARHLQSQALQGVLDELGDSLVAVRRSGRQPPLFLVHEITGTDLYFPVLAGHIDAEVPVYGLPGLPLGRPEARTIEAIAARMLPIVRRVQPEGPLRLAGWSFGGLVAYELARQLVARGDGVEFVGILDMVHAKQTPAMRDDAPQRTLANHCRLSFDAALNGGLDVDEATAAARRAAFDAIEPIAESLAYEALFERFSRAGLIPPHLEGLGCTAARQAIERMEAYRFAFEDYEARPPAAALELTVFAAEEGYPADDPLLGWDALVPPSAIRLLKVPGNHHSMMAGHVAALGQAMSAALRRRDAAA